MANKIMNSGLDALDNQNLNTSTSLWSVHLFQNNHTPAVGDTVVAYTECSYPGYVQQTPGSWTLAAATGGNKLITSPVMNFISTGSSGQSIYGYYVLDSGSNLIGAELFAGGPYTIPAAGSGVQLTVVLTDTAT